jgi:polyvinyl alcohol dehydrogenase (cytochrome)
MCFQELVFHTKPSQPCFPFTQSPRRSARIFLCAVIVALCFSFEAGAQASWPQFGQNNLNTANNILETTISPSSAPELKIKWKFTTKGDVSARPAVVEGVVFFPDWGGYLWAVNAASGKAIWGKKLASYVTNPSTGKGYSSPVYARATPAVSNGVIYLGLEAASGYFLAIEASTGNLLWKTRVETVDPDAMITASASVANGVVYVGVTSSQEGIPGGGPKTARGSVVALDAASGKIVWKTYMTTAGYTGAPVWGSSPVVDLARGTLFVSTGDNYSAPTDPEYLKCIHSGGLPSDCQSDNNHADSIVALSLKNGAVKWAHRLQDWPEEASHSGSDFFNLACTHGEPGCPTPAGPDFDFGSAPNEITYSTSSGPKTILGAGQKSGIYYALDPDSGELLWQTQVGPGSRLGGIMWGSAADGQRIYVAISNLEKNSYAGGTAGSWAALNPANGKILWQAPDPYSAMGFGPVTVANGVLFVPSSATKATDCNMIALDAATGKALWSFAPGASTIAGAAVVNGVVYWGTGYTHIPISEFTGGVNAFYAFSIDGK